MIALITCCERANAAARRPCRVARDRRPDRILSRGRLTAASSKPRSPTSTGPLTARRAIRRACSSVSRESLAEAPQQLLKGLRALVGDPIGQHVVLAAPQVVVQRGQGEGKAEHSLLKRFAEQLDRRGSVEMLRRGITEKGEALRVAGSSLAEGSRKQRAARARLTSDSSPDPGGSGRSA